MKKRQAFRVARTTRELCENHLPLLSSSDSEALRPFVLGMNVIHEN